MFFEGDKLQDGQYTVIRELGQGGMGVVYLCRDELLKRDCAIKMLLAELMSHKQEVEIFQEEARLAAQLEHPNIVTIYQVGKESRRLKVHHFMAMEYLPGGNLATRIKNEKISIEHALNWMKQLASGLNFAHKRGVVHRDIKSDNIFITQEGDLKIGDFGLARLLHGAVRRRTVHGMGTPAYMSPELCRGERQDHRSDIYSMGVLFYELLTGELPFKARGMVDMAMKHANAPVPSVLVANRNIPEQLDKVISKMMAKLPDSRYQSMSEVVEILDNMVFELRLERLGLRKPGGETGGSPALSHGSSFFAPRKESDTQAKNVVEERQAQLEVEPENEKLSEPATEPFQPDGIQGEKIENSPLAATGKPALPSTKPAVDPEFAPLWTFASKGPIGWQSCPVSGRDESMVFVPSADGTLYALFLADGKERWAYETGGPVVASPAVSADKAFVASADGAVYALSCQSGSLLWRYQADFALVSSPTISGDTLFITTMEGQLLAIDINAGSLKWKYGTEGAIVAPARVQQNLVFVCSKDGQVYALGIADGKLHWKFNTGAPLLKAPAVSADSLYVGNKMGMFYALDSSSGRSMWEYQTRKPIMSMPIVFFTSVLFAGYDKWLYCFDKYDGRLIWKAPVPGKVLADLRSFGDSIYLVTREGHIQANIARTGKLRFKLDIHKRFESAPLVNASLLLVGSVEGEVLAYTRQPSAGN